MKRLIFIIAITLSSSAYALQHFLVSEWYQNGQHFCKYDNGTVLNVGYQLCPLSI